MAYRCGLGFVSAGVIIWLDRRGRVPQSQYNRQSHQTRRHVGHGYSGIYRYRAEIPCTSASSSRLTGWAGLLSHTLALRAPAGLCVYMNRFPNLTQERAADRELRSQFVTYKQAVRRWL